MSDVKRVVWVRNIHYYNYETCTWLNWSTILEVKIRRNEKSKPFIYDELYLKYMCIEICVSNQN